MPKNLKTDWVRIGRSGDTIDGRLVTDQMVMDAAEVYDKEYYSAPIKSSHEYWYRFGTVEALRAAKNEEGGMDLFAILAPNQYYIQANEAGQKLHTSMELAPNFQKKGKWYLRGLAATDEPASVSTSEIKLSAKFPDSIFSDFTENTVKTFTEDTPPSWFSKFMSKEFTKNETEEPMSTKLLEEMQAKIIALESKLADKKPAADESKPKTEFEVLTETVVNLSEKVSALADTVASQNEPPADDNESEDYSALQKQVTELSEQLATALKKEGGTPAGENLDEDVQLSDHQ